MTRKLHTAMHVEVRRKHLGMCKRKLGTDGVNGAAAGRRASLFSPFRAFSGSKSRLSLLLSYGCFLLNLIDVVVLPPVLKPHWMTTTKAL